MDYMIPSTRSGKGGTIEVYPTFVIPARKKLTDLMIRGGDFYAVWDEDNQIWSTDEADAVYLIDKQLDAKAAELQEVYPNGKIKVLHMWDASTGMIDTWHKYCQRQMRDIFHNLDETLTFANTETTKQSYASKKLPYALEEHPTPAWDRLISVLYSDEERHKIEWSIGAIVSGQSKELQKFLVFYGAAGTGKSTVLKIIEKLFAGYCCAFDAKSLGQANSQFALEAFKSNPLVAIQQDGDLSHIEDNTKLNSLVSHETLTVNEKFKSQYEKKFNCFLFMGTNKPVKITDAKSGLIRRLIDVSPTGNKLELKEYNALKKQIDFELGGIAKKCLDIFEEDPEYYDDYVPTIMMGASNDFFNFVIDSYHIFIREPQITLTSAWEMYKTYVDEAKVTFPMNKRAFKEELKNYFKDFKERIQNDDGSRLRSVYEGFKTDIFEEKDDSKKKKPKKEELKSKDEFIFEEQPSILDEYLRDNPAQYASANETPKKKWIDISTTLKDLDTHKLHYVKVPENHIVIDFDIKDEQGNKSLELNIAAAKKWPKTYAELSKSGSGIHLHYIYTGDVSKLSRIYDDSIEIKVFNGDSSLRRKLTKCINNDISKISSGLPLKGETKLINWDGIKNEKMLRSMIKRNLLKEYHPATKPSIDYIYNLLEEAYASGIPYDVSDMQNDIIAFAAQSTHQADYCLKLVRKMQFKSEKESAVIPFVNNDSDDDIIFYDIEVFPNLFLVNWKLRGDAPVVRMINPTPAEIEDLVQHKLVGFNCRRYDNHILYARILGYNNQEIYDLSQRIVNGDTKALFREAYNISYTDVYDFSTTKQSLKKFEIELGIHHQELGLPWDKPVDPSLWNKVAEYCDNDVIATEAVFNARQADYVARKIQIAIVKSLHGIDNVSMNETTNSLSAKIIFGNEKKPQSEFNYRDLSQPVGSSQYEEYRIKFGPNYIFRVFDADGLPQYRDYIPGEVLPDGWSILPFFPGYKFDSGVSTYLGEEIGEGGKVYGRPGMYPDVWDGDIASMHPHSAIFECLFGPKYTRIFEEIVKARVAIKHKDFELAGTYLNGALKPYLNEEQADGLAQALKIVINAIYGLTSSNYDVPFRDIRNKDNIVAKRGALFMTLLKREVEKLGYSVCHIKTDSIKIPNADQKIQDFVIKFGHEFGYSFETEANFSKYCLVNDAVYIAKNKDGKHAGEWTAVGKQFAVPYVFKTLFSHEAIEFKDMCEAFAVQTALYLDMNEYLCDVSEYEREYDIRQKEAKTGKKMRHLFDISDEELIAKIAEGHDYKFIGKTGLFCPVKEGKNGGVLVRDSNGKFTSATGAKDYRWLESEFIRSNHMEDYIDKSFYEKLVNEAVDAISQYGDFEWFISEEDVPELDYLPWTVACGKEKCTGCKNLNVTGTSITCSAGYDISDVERMNRKILN